MPSPEGFEREGNDIFLKVKLPLKTALLGGKVPVPTIWGPVEVTVPSGVSLNQSKKLSKKGINNRGDMYIDYVLDIPKYCDLK